MVLPAWIVPALVPPPVAPRAMVVLAVTLRLLSRFSAPVALAVSAPPVVMVLGAPALLVMLCAARLMLPTDCRLPWLTRSALPLTVSVWFVARTPLLLMVPAVLCNWAAPTRRLLPPRVMPLPAVMLVAVPTLKSWLKATLPAVLVALSVPPATVVPPACTLVCALTFRSVCTCTLLAICTPPAELPKVADWPASAPPTVMPFCAVAPTVPWVARLPPTAMEPCVAVVLIFPLASRSEPTLMVPVAAVAVMLPVAMRPPAGVLPKVWPPPLARTALPWTRVAPVWVMPPPAVSLRPAPDCTWAWLMLPPAVTV